MGLCLFSLAVVFFLIGLVQLFSPVSLTPLQVRRPARRTAVPRPGAARGVSEAMGVTSSSTGSMVNNTPKFDWIEVGKRIHIRHPVKGDLQAHVSGQITFAELWQRAKDPQSPWVPSGNLYTGSWLEGDLFLLSWQNRLYVLDEAVELSDVEIQRDFLPHARKFSQSDQTADVYFAYPPAMWHIDDIGRFRVEQIEGEGLRYQIGGIGRFIHASGDGGRALVVEDFRGGDGQDIAWIGYQIAEEDIRRS